MIEINNLEISLGEFNLRDINLRINLNEFFVLMGPTGAGKTVLLEAIAGLIPVKRGAIIIDGIDMTSMPPEKRGIGIVYQDYSLFPHLTVRDNLLYGLNFHRSAKARSKKMLDRLVNDLDLPSLLNRYPGTLSGGEKQRVSLGRALMVEPRVLLLDEPLSALDTNFREEIRNNLKRLHKESNVTFLMVTHDFAEALSLADRSAVMNEGRIEQCGLVEDIFQRPNSTFVADFVGMKNLFRARFDGTRAIIKDLAIELGKNSNRESGYIAIRPEDIVLSRKILSSSMRNSFIGVVSAVLDRGFYYEVEIRVKDIIFKSMITKRSLFELGIQEGLELSLSFKSTGIHCF